MCAQVKRLVAAVLAASCLMTSACALQRATIATSALDFNLAVEQAQNRMFLVNVLRAVERSPLYLTDISKITGGVKIELDGTAAVELDRGFSAAANKNGNLFKPSLAGSYAVNPTFEVPVLDTQEFMQGFLAPLTLDRVQYYLDRGWPPELLVWLFVQRAKVGEAVFANYPDARSQKQCELERFAKFVQAFVNGHPRAVDDTIKNAKSLTVKTIDAKDIATVEKDWSVTQTSTGDYQLVKKGIHLELDANGLADLQALTSACMPGAPWTDEPSATKVEWREPKVSTDKKLPQVELTLRSPEGVLYYLGELARVALKQKVMLNVCIGKKLQPLFVLREGHAGRARLEVSRARRDYYIPEGTDEQPPTCDETGKIVTPVQDLEGQSMHALSLLSQLVALQKSGKDFPNSGVVRVVNP